MRDVFLTYAKRTPMGKIGGLLAPVRVDDLMALVLKDLKESISFDPSTIDDVLIGCANQAGEDNRNIARMSLLLAGLPFDVPGSTFNRLCGSSLDTVMGATARIQAGMAHCIIAGGAESMSRAPFAISKSQSPYARDQKMHDTSFGWRFINPKMKELFPLYGMGETAEEVATLFNISREDQDKFALRSHQKAALAYSEGKFKDELIDVEVTLKKSSYTVQKDECLREDTDLKKLSKLKAVFRSQGSVTAGNSSPMNDGASAVMLVSEEFLKRNNLTPILKITGAQVKGLHPNTMGLGPIEAVNKLCSHYNYKLNDFDVFELNEAFAAQSLACIRSLKIPEEKVNINGGAIALGHPLGCSGTRILTTLSHIMKSNKDYKKGIATMCIGVGQGIAISVENCS